MSIIEILYTVFVSISLLACVPQTVQLFKVKQSKEFDIRSWIIWLIAQLISTIYFIDTKAYLTAIFSVGWLAYYVVMSVMIVYYRYRPSRELQPVRVPVATDQDLPE